jgi:phosphoribosylglycinamide formyltransferase-1
MGTAAAPLLARAPVAANDPLRIGVLASGSGTNLQALLDRTQAPSCRYRVVVVGVNKADAGAQIRAQSAGVPSFFEDHRGRSRAEFEDALHAHLQAANAELIVLAGFMRVLTAHFLDRWQQRVVNIHPALLPSFPGTHAVRQALAYGAKITGVTVHLVDSGVDTGPILAQRAVEILPGESEDALSARVHVVEHALYPSVIDAIARGDVPLPLGGDRAVRPIR